MTVGLTTLGHSFGFNLAKIKFDAQRETLARLGGLDFSEIETNYKDAKDLQSLFNYFVQKGGYDKFTPISSEEQVEAWLAGQDNKCVDGSDDGKISAFSKIGNFFEGMGKTVVGSIKSFKDNPKKAAKFVATAAVMAGLITFGGPVGWVVASVVGLYGAVSLIKGGIHDFVEATKIANNATTDAEAMSAYEQMGSGTLQVGVGVVCAKASVDGIRAGYQSSKPTVDDIFEGQQTPKTSAGGVRTGQQARRTVVCTEQQAETFLDEFVGNLKDISVIVDNS